jgi:hypothetical protein
MFPTIKAGAEIVWAFILAHRGLISVSGITAIVGSVMFVIRWYRSRRLLRCARELRRYATHIRVLSPDPVKSFHVIFLRKHLGSEGRYIYDVLELMEEKHWARKLEYPVGEWEIN